MPAFPAPQAGASLLLSFASPIASSSSSPARHDTLLLLSPNRLSAVRTFAALEAGYSVVIGAAVSDIWDEELLDRRERAEVGVVEFELGAKADEGEWGVYLDALPGTLKDRCMLIVLNDTLPAPGESWRGRRTFASAQDFRAAASKRRYLVNIADAPTLSDFSWPTTHRFDLTPSPLSTTASAKSPLQLAITTNSSACRLATRLRREVVATLPSTIGSAVLAISSLRTALASESKAGTGWSEGAVEEADVEIEVGGTSLNRPAEQLSRAQSDGLERAEVVGRQLTKADEEEMGERGLSPCRARALERRRFSNGASSIGATSSSMSSSQLSTAPSSTDDTSVATWTALEAQRTRMRYVAQISEYWPLDRLASVTLSSLSAPTTPQPSSPPSPTLTPLSSRHSLAIVPPPQAGRILLLGTGPGSTLLLTRLAYLFLTSPPGSPYHVDLFLSDKLVPSEILALIPSPRREGVIIARKFPGNAENAQDEFMRLAVEGARAGKTVLRMKQGDPFLYGRGGEEVLHFRAAGFDPVVIPGLSSCLAGPTICGIPVTQRGVAESLVVCTGVGRGGREVGVEGYERGKTLVVLMGVARLESLIASLLQHSKARYPPYLPIALIERASSPDQRVVSATIETLEKVLKQLSPHRPPGMIVIGWGVMCLEGTEGKGDMTILDDDVGEEKDRERVAGWLGEKGYRVKEGLGEGWRSVVEGSGL